MTEIFQIQPEAGAKNVAAETANYQGNWTLVQRERMSGPDFASKYAGLIDESMPSLREGDPGIFDKPEQFQEYHRTLAETYASRNEHVYAAIGYAAARQYGLSPHQTGRGSIGEQGTVFTDATTKDGTPLTGRQKDIIAAHEAYHGIIKAPPAANAALRVAFDGKAYDEIINEQGVKQPGYLKSPDELMARMAQLKNYFGMQGGEAFTEDHLKYARMHYVEDTGLDNSMTIMFHMISPGTEQEFIRAMNTLPV